MGMPVCRAGLQTLAGVSPSTRWHDAPFPDPEGGMIRGWFACHERGVPSDSETACAVLEDLTAAGLWDGGPVEVDVDRATSA